MKVNLAKTLFIWTFKQMWRENLPGDCGILFRIDIFEWNNCHCWNIFGRQRPIFGRLLRHCFPFTKSRRKIRRKLSGNVEKTADGYFFLDNFNRAPHIPPVDFKVIQFMMNFAMNWLPSRFQSQLAYFDLITLHWIIIESIWDTTVGPNSHNFR